MRQYETPCFHKYKWPRLICALCGKRIAALGKRRRNG